MTTERPTEEQLARIRTWPALLARTKRVPLQHGVAIEVVTDLLAEVDALTAERDEARQWVRDLHSGMYVNCVYCGHRYGPKDEVPATMADALKDHIEQCPKHPMSALKRQNAELRTRTERMIEPSELSDALNNLKRDWDCFRGGNSISTHHNWQMRRECVNRAIENIQQFIAQRAARGEKA